jgi:hypothetical protein
MAGPASAGVKLAVVGVIGTSAALIAPAAASASTLPPAQSAGASVNPAPPATPPYPTVAGVPVGDAFTVRVSYYSPFSFLGGTAAYIADPTGQTGGYLNIAGGTGFGGVVNAGYGARATAGPSLMVRSVNGDTTYAAQWNPATSSLSLTQTYDTSNGTAVGGTYQFPVGPDGPAPGFVATRVGTWYSLGSEQSVAVGYTFALPKGLVPILEAPYVGPAVQTGDGTWSFPPNYIPPPARTNDWSTAFGPDEGGPPPPLFVPSAPGQQGQIAPGDGQGGATQQGQPADGGIAPGPSQLAGSGLLSGPSQPASTNSPDPATAPASDGTGQPPSAPQGAGAPAGTPPAPAQPGGSDSGGTPATPAQPGGSDQGAPAAVPAAPAVAAPAPAAPAVPADGPAAPDPAAPAAPAPATPAPAAPGPAAAFIPSTTGSYLPAAGPLSGPGTASPVYDPAINTGIGTLASTGVGTATDPLSGIGTGVTTNLDTGITSGLSGATSLPSVAIDNPAVSIGSTSFTSTDLGTSVDPVGAGSVGGFSGGAGS